jgi:hypothetical protein
MTSFVDAKIPTALFVGKNDNLGDSIDTKWLTREISSHQKLRDEKYIVHYEEIDGNH